MPFDVVDPVTVIGLIKNCVSSLRTGDADLRFYITTVEDE